MKAYGAFYFADGDQEALQQEAGILSRGLERQIDPDQHLQITDEFRLGESSRIRQGLIDGKGGFRYQGEPFHSIVAGDLGKRRIDRLLKPTEVHAGIE